MFNGQGATLTLDHVGNLRGAIGGVDFDETFDLVGVTANGATVNGSNQLVVTDNGTTVDTLQLSGNNSGYYFLPVAVSGGTDIVSLPIPATVADYLAAHPVPLVVDPVMVASSGAKLLEDDAVGALVERLFPLAVVVTPNLVEARALAGLDAPRAQLAERLHELGAPAVVVTGGHGDDAVDHLFDGSAHIEIPVERHDVAATHGSGCTHSATLTALLAGGMSLIDAARGAAAAASRAVSQGLVELGAGEGPVDVLGVRNR